MMPQKLYIYCFLKEHFKLQCLISFNVVYVIEIDYCFPFRSAFFEGVIEKPCHKVKKAIMGCQQTEVLCAINTDGITVIDKEKPVSIYSP